MHIFTWKLWFVRLDTTLSTKNTSIFHISWTFLDGVIPISRYTIHTPLTWGIPARAQLNRVLLFSSKNKPPKQNNRHITVKRISQFNCQSIIDLPVDQVEKITNNSVSRINISLFLLTNYYIYIYTCNLEYKNLT